MDGSHFDALTRSLIQDRSRRDALGALLGGTLGLLGLTASAAKKKGGKGKSKGKGKKKKKKPCNASTCPNGCCQGGRCLPGTSNTACEKHGVACENCSVQGEVCNQYQSCQCDEDLCRKRGNHCCFDGRCVADGEFGVVCDCAGADMICSGVSSKPCCAGYRCGADHRCCGEKGTSCGEQICCLGLVCENHRCVEHCDPSCTTGQMCCNGSCVPINTSNCSGCGQGCPAYAADQCVDGHCKCGGGDPCDCLQGAVCINGRCVCNTSRVDEGRPGQQVCSATLQGTSCSHNGGGIGPCPNGNDPLCVCTPDNAEDDGRCPV